MGTGIAQVAAIAGQQVKTYNETAFLVLCVNQVISVFEGGDIRCLGGPVDRLKKILEWRTCKVLLTQLLFGLNIQQ